ncbi:hypothetical protein NKR23_g9729 [Pleurostoma richardsiae]|uniref:Uncharacterized protein n=1 Tax=Pleurostoma richardsiae TaxID=41990 RepID=A0AA38RMC3_9PEZI|nr:hypothetical protein NKR23_g9729 [Pleurostoma richardsiae]
MSIIAVSINNVGDTNFTQPMLLYFGENATTPQYIGSVAGDGSAYTLDLSSSNASAGQLGLVLPGASSLVFNQDGIDLFSGDCSTVSSVNIDNFWNQAQSMGATNTTSFLGQSLGRWLEKRQSASVQNVSYFTVQVSIDSYINNGGLALPNLTFGNTACTLDFTSLGTPLDNITWTCMYPPPGSGRQHCENGLSSWLYGNSSTQPSSGNTSVDALSTLNPLFASAGTSIATLFPGAGAGLSRGFTFLQRIEGVARQAVSFVGNTACGILHAFDQNTLVISDNGTLGTITIGAYASSPPATSMAVNLASSATASETRPPPRILNPTDNLLRQIATIFPSLLAPFLSLIGALPTLSLLPLPLGGGIFGMPTDGVAGSGPLTAPAAPTTTLLTLRPTTAAVAGLTGTVYSPSTPADQPWTRIVTVIAPATTTDDAVWATSPPSHEASLLQLSAEIAGLIQARPSNEGSLLQLSAAIAELAHVGHGLVPVNSGSISGFEGALRSGGKVSSTKTPAVLITTTVTVLT